ncbi:hypothetical protein [Marinomonas pollencensis]|uniref:Uncharacterized protein n=1 Tax=Marinomonas pollencensis TaxID=491954 RepID=A0A3E0DTD2_9GAMM|nr:hypothetical protein [Marinomonas pollencensis]REG86817.1 hypothetical protein DFP81_101386 [Marinomonas pollencensis]
MKYNVKMLAITAAISLALVGCASSPNGAAVPSKADTEAQSQLSSEIEAVSTAINKASVTLASAKDGQLDWFATDHVDKAQQALDKAKQFYAEFANDPSEANDSIGFFNSQTNMEAALENLSVFNATISQAEAIREQSLSILEDAFANRKQLQAIGSDKLYPTTYKQLDSELKSLVDQVAASKTDAAIKAQPSLLGKQRELEIKTAIKVYLSDAKDKLKRLELALVKNYAPQTLAQASAALREAEAFIAAEPRATAKIQAKAAGVMFAINHAEQVSIAVKKLRAMPQSANESYILNIEKLLLAISNELGAVDSRDQRLSKQGQLIVQFIKDSMKNEQAVQTAQQALKDTIAKQNNSLDLLNQQIDTLNSKLADKTAYVNSLQNQVANLMTQLEIVKKSAQLKTTAEQPTAAAADAIETSSAPSADSNALEETTNDTSTATERNEDATNTDNG